MTVPQLVALDLPPGDAFVAELRRAWDEGDAVLPVDQRLPPPARAELLAEMRPARVVHPAGSTRLADARPVEPGDALVVATSGSTGRPKGVVLTMDAVVASAHATSARLGVGLDDHWLACLPLAHVGGLSVVTRAVIRGTPLTVIPTPDPPAIAEAARSGATLVSLVATLLRRIDPTAFRVIVLGGSRPPPDRPANTVTTYGMTETGSGVVYDGRPLDGVEIRFDTDGVIGLRCPMLLRSYRDGSVPLTSDGWFSTGDVGRLLPDGRLHVDGRLGDLVITGGENVWPEVVEAALRSHDAVADAAVVGVPDDEWGQRLVAVVVPADVTAAPTLADLRAHVRAVLPAQCAPKELRFATTLPRTAIGKLRRSEIVALVTR